MTNAKPHNLFTSETAKVARQKSGFAKKGALKLQRYLAKLGIEKDYIDMLVKGLQSPVVAGVAMYLLIMAIERIVNAAQKASQTTPSAPSQNVPSWLTKYINQFLGQFVTTPVGIGLNVGSLLSGSVGADFAALKAVILVYIASGGNLAGLLSSATNIFGTIAKTAAI